MIFNIFFKYLDKFFIKSKSNLQTHFKNFNFSFIFKKAGFSFFSIVSRIQDEILTSSFYEFHFHAYPNDYFRFTTSGIRSLLEDDTTIEEIAVYGGPTVALISLFAEYVTLFTFSQNVFLNAVARGLALFFTFPLKYIDALLVKNRLSRNICSTILVIARKV